MEVCRLEVLLQYMKRDINKLIYMCHSLCRQKTMVCHRCVNCHCDNINYFDIDAEVILLVSDTCSQFLYILLTV